MYVSTGTEYAKRGGITAPESRDVGGTQFNVQVPPSKLSG